MTVLNASSRLFILVNFLAKLDFIDNVPRILVMTTVPIMGELLLIICVPD